MTSKLMKEEWSKASDVAMRRELYNDSQRKLRNPQPGSQAPELVPSDLQVLKHLLSGTDVAMESAAVDLLQQGFDSRNAAVVQEALKLDVAVEKQMPYSVPDALVANTHLEKLKSFWFRQKQFKCAIRGCDSRVNLLVRKEIVNHLGAIGADCADSGDWKPYWEAVDANISVAERSCKLCHSAAKMAGLSIESLHCIQW